MQQFRIPDYLMSNELKLRMQEIKKKYNKVSEQFLDLFEKRFIIFIEDGVDLKEECNCFQQEVSETNDYYQSNNNMFAKYSSF